MKILKVIFLACLFPNKKSCFHYSIFLWKTKRISNKPFNHSCSFV